MNKSGATEPRPRDTARAASEAPTDAPDGAPGGAPVETPATGGRTFAHVLVNTAVANLTTNFLWFAIVFWVYLETRSILATGVLGAVYMFLLAGCSTWFGSLVDRMRKHRVMLLSAWATLIAFTVGCALFFAVPGELLLRLDAPWFWLFTLVVLAGCVVELMRNLALATTVTLLVPVERHANANGLVGTVQGLAFIATSVLSGLSIGLLGMGTTILLATLFVAVPLVHLHLLRIPEPVVARDPDRAAVDFRGGMAAMLAVPGLFALVLFSTFNNLGSGAFMALLDPYGLTMFPVEVWGLVFGLASTGFIVGGLAVAKWGLGPNPIRTMLVLVGILGVVGIAFTIREWPWLFIAGIWVFMALMPAVEAAEQTVIQRVVPFEKQGRVFGLAMTFEAAAAPITSLIIAPIAEFWIVPFMRTDTGQREWGWLLGEGDSRGIALIFVCTGIGMILLACAAFFTRSYRTLSRGFAARPATGPAPRHGAPETAVD
ncbi:MFS transporter [Leucobacter aridicollis]|uniref:DHA3 family multidrug efflux protein-like MFS transporter n=1 Tax=Leucobacter aridicollis TaxID=283878 RepID=A0A852R1T9_9MICO|nr:MFS transporter [Leucobacter aridicollis]MBL3683822.1 MFS transporter [Leucobacter aridicollis]NYD26567.1 DHA3 family multidrug efflux protein-like MFS transporter [Leucobacter aridicollis]